jgi:uncharacterized protein (TIGR02118 family)
VPVRLIALYQVPADTDAFDRHYHEVHTPIVLRYPKLRELIVGNVEPIGPRSVPYYLATQMIFDSREDLDAAMASEAGIESGRDLKNFAEAGVTLYVSDDSSTTVLRPGEGGGAS